MTNGPAEDASALERVDESIEGALMWEELQSTGPVLATT